MKIKELVTIANRTEERCENSIQQLYYIHSFIHLTI